MFWFIITVVLVITFRKEIVSLFSLIVSFVSSKVGRIKEKMTPMLAIKAKEKEVQAKFVRNLSETEELYKVHTLDFDYCRGDAGEYIRFYTSDGNVVDVPNDGGLWIAVRRLSHISLVVTRDETGKIINKEYFPIKAEIYY